MEAAQVPTVTETPPEPAEALTAPPAGPQDAPDAGAEPPETGERERGEDGRLLSREAAGYRRRLREAEGERDQLRERLDRLQRSEVERLASANGLAVAGDIWLHGATLDTLRDDDGMIDSQTVVGLVGELVKDRPGLKAPTVGSFRGGEGSSAVPARQPALGLSSLLKR